LGLPLGVICAHRRNARISISLPFAWPTKNLVAALNLVAVLNIGTLFANKFQLACGLPFLPEAAADGRGSD
jgi:hypothetical protein